MGQKTNDFFLRHGIEMDSDSLMHWKYIKREPDGKGGWIYTYPGDKIGKAVRGAVEKVTGKSTTQKDDGKSSKIDAILDLYKNRSSSGNRKIKGSERFPATSAASDILEDVQNTLVSARKNGRISSEDIKRMEDYRVKLKSIIKGYNLESETSGDDNAFVGHKLIAAVRFIEAYYQSNAIDPKNLHDLSTKTPTPGKQKQLKTLDKTKTPTAEELAETKGVKVLSNDEKNARHKEIDAKRTEAKIQSEYDKRKLPIEKSNGSVKLPKEASPAAIVAENFKDHPALYGITVEVTSQDGDYQFGGSHVNLSNNEQFWNNKYHVRDALDTLLKDITSGSYKYVLQAPMQELYLLNSLNARLKELGGTPYSDEDINKCNRDAVTRGIVIKSPEQLIKEYNEKLLAELKRTIK